MSLDSSERASNRRSSSQTKQGRQPLPPHAQERDGVLTIPRTAKSDEGHYVCTAFDPETRTPTDAPPAHIAVRPAKLQPQVDPIEQSIPEGSPFRIRCWVPGNPNVHLSWRKTQGEINEDSVQDRGILTVNRAQLSDEGDYICSAEDPRTGEEAEAPPATVHVTPRARPPDVGDVERGPQITPPEQRVPEGDPASIRCWVEGDPQARLSFKRADGAPIPFGATDLDGVLAISSTLKSDEGDYISGEPPRPVATPPVLTVKRGQPAQFHCDANSPTPAQIKWGHGDADSDLPEGVSHVVDDIVIDIADDSHEGEYVCSATNEFGTGVAEPVQLVVTDDEHASNARVEPRVWNGKPGDKHQFKCHVTGVPTPKASDYGSVNNVDLHYPVKTYSRCRPRTHPTGGKAVGPWTGGGDLPDDYKPVTISEQFIRHPAIGLGNAGAYTCKGSNSHATATKNIYVEGGRPASDRRRGAQRTRTSALPTLQSDPPLMDTRTKSKRNKVLLTKETSAVEIEPPRVRIVSQGESIVLKCGVEDPKSRVIWWRTENLIDALMVGSTQFLHLHSVDVCERGIYYCTDESTNYGYPHSVNTLVVLQHSLLGAKNGAHFEWALLRGGNIVRKLGNEATLHIKGADPSNDYGVYRCNVEDDNGVVIGSAYTAVSVGYSGQSSGL
ncbi:immunoglobulin domain protein [Cooperia oncophora]